MPELPEIASRTKEIKEHLVGKTIEKIEIIQPKCLNITPEAFEKGVCGAQILNATYRGKWILVSLSSGWLLLNMGMGGELLLTDREHLPAKNVMVIDFNDGTCLAIHFWWFGYIHFCAPDELNRHEMTARLGPNVLEILREEFAQRLVGKKGKLKAFLLDQQNVAGIGNAYIHDILFLAKLHPNRALQSLTTDEVESLFDAIHKGLEPSLLKGGAAYEKDLFGNKGGFSSEEILIGYREGAPCPVCATPILKIKTGSTSSYICPSCQLEP